MTPLRLLLPAALLAAALTGCATRSPAPVPETNLPAAWLNLPPSERLADEVLATWWTQYNDPALTTLVDQALLNNYSLLTAYERVTEALALRNIAAGERLPAVNGAAALAETRLSNASGGSAGNRSFTFHSLGLDASWELDLWGRIRNTVTAADAGLRASVEDSRQARALLAAQVVTTYLTYRELQLRLQAADDNIARQTETLALTRGRFDAGLVPKLDVHQAELNLARTRAIRPRLLQQKDAALRALEVLTAQNPGTLTESLSAPAPIPLPPETSLDELPANVIRRRPDLRAAEQQLLAAAARVNVAQADLLPRISLSGSFAFEARETSDLFDGDSVATRFGPFLSVPLFQGGRLRASVDASESRARQAELRYKQLVLTALEDVENALSAYQQETRRRQDLQDGVTAAETTVTQVRSLYENGLVTFLNVLDAERNLAAVQDEAAASLGQTARNLAAIYRAFGGGWSPE